MRIRDSLIDYRNSFTQPEKVHQVQCVVSKKWAKANAWNMSTKKKKQAAHAICSPSIAQASNCLKLQNFQTSCIWCIYFMVLSHFHCKFLIFLLLLD